MCQGLKLNRALTSLDLSNNSIGQDDCGIICHALSSGTKLVIESLNLGYNSIGSSGAAQLSDLLRVCHTLTKLDLTKSAISVIGWCLLSDAAIDNPFISKIVMDSNDFGTKPSLSYLMESRGNMKDEELQLLTQKN